MAFLGFLVFRLLISTQIRFFDSTRWAEKKIGSDRLNAHNTLVPTTPSLSIGVTYAARRDFLGLIRLSHPEITEKEEFRVTITKNGEFRV